MRLLEMWPNVVFFPSVRIRPYVENLLTDNKTHTKLMLIIDNADDCCQKCMENHCYTFIGPVQQKSYC